MEMYYTIVIFVFGLALGSFYNVVGSRLPEGRSIINPPSSCTKCNHRLKWYELIPVLSFIMQMGKCRKCKTKLSFFYPATELLTGILLAISYLLFGFTYEFWISFVIVSFFIIVLVSDIYYYIIPDEVTIVCSLLVFIINVFMLDFLDVIYSLGSALILFGAMYLLMIGGNKLFKKESLGGGDIKLMVFVGLVLNPLQGISTIFLSSVIALPISIIIIYAKKKDIIPFGPYILMAMLMVFWFGIDLFNFFEPIV